ncbi:MAG: sensor histidine kinase, partial [Pseudonocardiaceae bacterium]
LREALGVLIDNALRHGGGEVTLSARPGGAGREGMVVLEVTDAGDGVPEALAPHVFDRGVSGASSTGVGLALARALIEADGGRLELSSARPATFAVYLRVPRAEDLAGSPRSDAGSAR